MNKVEKNLKERHLDPSRYNVSWDKEVASFLLFNLSGQIVGYLNYRPDADKVANNDMLLSRYYAHVSKAHRLVPAEDKDYKWYNKVPVLNRFFGKAYPWAKRRERRRFFAVWGLETFYYRHDILFVVEGLFDAVRLHNLNLPAIAVLSNDPKAMKPWRRTLPRHVVCICDGDKAGRKLGKLGDEAVFLPEGRDLGDMTDAEVYEVVKKWM